MYEMLGMYEDALVQYDELDALFTQFLLNHNAGRKFIIQAYCVANIKLLLPDHAGWIADLASRKCLSWNGLCLSQPINIDKRQLIKVNEAALLDFRDYLFSRQCTSLFLQFKPWEVAKRSIPFLHNCLKEIKMLSVGILPYDTHQIYIVFIHRFSFRLVPLTVGFSWVAWKFSARVRSFQNLVTWRRIHCTRLVSGIMPEQR